MLIHADIADITRAKMLALLLRDDIDAAVDAIDILLLRYVLFFITG